MGRLIRCGLLLCAFWVMVLLCACGEADDIIVITRERGSGTRAAFEAAVGDISERAVVTNSNAVILLSVSGSSRAIAYIPSSAFVQAGGEAAFCGIKVIPVRADFDAEFELRRELFAVIRTESRSEVFELIEFACSWECCDLAAALGYGHYTQSGNVDIFEKRISVGGSSSIVPFFEAVCDEWNLRGGCAVVHQSDSSSGLQALEAGILDIALCSRQLTESETEKGFIAIPVLYDELIIIASRDFAADELSFDALRGIFSGELSFDEGVA